LVVVGSHGRGKLTEAILGSVSQSVIHHAECPVLVVR
jgi:nucleotide-binding universal stress UspA family protein